MYCTPLSVPFYVNFCYIQHCVTPAGNRTTATTTTTTTRDPIARAAATVARGIATLREDHQRSKFPSVCLLLKSAIAAQSCSLEIRAPMCGPNRCRARAFRCAG